MPARRSAELIAGYLDAVVRKDASAVARYFDRDVEYMVNGTPAPDPAAVLPPLSEGCHSALPWLGIYHGQRAVEEFLAHMHRNLDIVAFGPREVIAQEDKAAAFGWFRLRALPTGRTADISYSIFVELRGGLIVKYHFLENTFDVAAAFHAGGWWLINTDGTLHRVSPSSRPPEQTTSPASLSIRAFTSTEPGAWSNAYLISDGDETIVFDVPMLRSDATRLADMIDESGARLTAILISHAHPDHFMGLDVITDRFPEARVASTPNVVADLNADGPAIFALLKGKLGADGPTRLVVPQPLTAPRLRLGDGELEIVEFGEGESKHTAAVYIPSAKALLSADLVYNGAHLYLAERHLDAWLERLDELEQYAHERVSAIYPGHGASGDLRLIAATRSYLRDFAAAVQSQDASIAERQLLAKYPGYRLKQFLTAFSLPAYFAAPSA